MPRMTGIELAQALVLRGLLMTPFDTNTLTDALRDALSDACEEPRAVAP